MREGKILQVNLSKGTVEIESRGEEFFRSYLGGGAIGSYFLLTETGPDTLALSPDNILTIAPGPATGAAVSGVSRCSITALSPETGAIGDTQAGGSFGPFLRRSGLEAVVLRGRAERPCYLYLHDGTGELLGAEELRGKKILEVHDLLSERYADTKISIVQCGPAGENLVRFASLASDLNNVYGRTGMGAVFGSKNLRAIVASGSGKTEFADPETLKELSRKAVERVTKEGVGDTLHTLGTPGIVGGNALSGNLCVHNYSAGYHEDYEKLDGSNYDERIGSKGTTCFACVIGCRKTVKAENPYQVTDRLGGPEFETLGVLGSNLDIFDPVAVSKANELCNNYGIDTITMGGLASFLCEALEKQAVSADRIGIDDFGFGRPDGLLELITQTAERRGIGKVVAEGFEATVAHLGEAAAPYAVHVKGHGFAVHMPQVKPSMALLYAVSPIGADHMSSEHDWIAADGSEAAHGLGLFSPGDLNSYDTKKVRAVTYSQLFYSILDSLGLCMFVWGPGSVYNYQDLEKLVRAATGWEVTLWELMKAGERRINMMRLVNLRRGFSSDADELPEKMFIPLKAGPSEGRSVDREGFRNMREAYYALMGWDEAGIPTRGKLIDLDLEWAAE